MDLPFSNGHIQAVGTDAAGRRQYLYHERWREDRDEEKHRRVLRLAEGLPEKRVLAGALRMLDRGDVQVRADDDRLLCHRKGEIHAEDINRRFQELTTPDFTAKDLRTWHATVLAAVLIAGHEPPGSATARRRTEKAVMREVAEQLGNTPAVARRSYVDPRVLTAWADGRTIERALERAAGVPIEDARPAIERAVIRLLERY